ncbi:MAG: hypothetical protein EXR96_04355 [Nitrospiraceae bacterium]|nr:hypothetical protein [Nitrospiraceae bacterium]
MTGLIGHKRQTFTAVGDVVNVADRLEKVCTPERILIDLQTYNDISHIVDARKKNGRVHHHLRRSQDGRVSRATPHQDFRRSQERVRVL